MIDLSDASVDRHDNEIQELTESMMKDPRCSFGKSEFAVSKAAAFARIKGKHGLTCCFLASSHSLPTKQALKQ